MNGIISVISKLVHIKHFTPLTKISKAHEEKLKVGHRGLILDDLSKCHDEGLRCPHGIVHVENWCISWYYTVLVQRMIEKFRCAAWDNMDRLLHPVSYFS